MDALGEFLVAGRMTDETGMLLDGLTESRKKIF
jgi:hypothetical protein